MNVRDNTYYLVETTPYTDAMTDQQVCDGHYGFIPESESSTTEVEGLELACPDGQTYKVTGGSKSDNLKSARRLLKNKGFNADITMEEL